MKPPSLAVKRNTEASCRMIQIVHSSPVEEGANGSVGSSPIVTACVFGKEKDSQGNHRKDMEGLERQLSD